MLLHIHTSMGWCPSALLQHPLENGFVEVTHLWLMSRFSGSKKRWKEVQHMQNLVTSTQFFILEYLLYTLTLNVTSTTPSHISLCSS